VCGMLNFLPPLPLSFESSGVAAGRSAPCCFCVGCAPDEGSPVWLVESEGPSRWKSVAEEAALADSAFLASSSAMSQYSCLGLC
jgi:hypothetical protein